MRVLLLLLIIVPIVEIFVLIQVGKQIGGFATIGLILATAFIGVGLLRAQGYRAMEDARRKMAEGTLPAKEMADGVFLAVGGALLLTPGFVTDAIGFCCLIPGVRHAILGGLLQRAGVMTIIRTQRPSPPPADKNGGRTIDGEYRREDD